MKNTTLTLSFNTEKLDALTFHMGKRDANLQEELNETVQKLYEKYVPQATREYIDDKVSRDGAARERPAVRPDRLPVSWRVQHRKAAYKSCGGTKTARSPVSAPVRLCVGFSGAGRHPCTPAAGFASVGAVWPHLPEKSRESL